MQPEVKPIDIADACFCQGDCYRALEHYFPLLRTLEKTLGPDHLDTAAIYYNIGATYDKMKWDSDAIHHYHKALAIRESALGPSHPDTALTYKSIAHVYGRQGYGYWLWNCESDLAYLMSDMNFLLGFNTICCDHYQIASDYYRKALDYYESCTPADEAVMQEIHQAIQTMETKKEAENSIALDNYQKALEISTRLYGPDSKPIAKVRYCLDQFIDKTNKMLDEFEKDDARWKAIGRSLGFNF